MSCEFGGKVDLDIKTQTNCLIKKIQEVGAALYILEEMINHEIFDNLSKHNPYWHSESEEDSEKLYEIRCKLSYLEDKLCEARDKLEP